MNARSTAPKPKTRPRLGRPTKKVSVFVRPFLSGLAMGESRRRAAAAARVSPKTVQRWLRTDSNFRKEVLKAEKRGSHKAPYLRWLHHPFRGLRPPLSEGQHQLPRPQPRFNY
jgi:hypothetical protein